MPKILKEEIKTAIKYIEESRQSHLNWIDHEKKYPSDMYYARPTIDLVGGKIHHEVCVDKYNFVIDILERMK